MSLYIKQRNLQNSLAKMKSTVIAFSGGVDSTYLLHQAATVMGRDKVLAVTARSDLFLEEEKENACRLAEKLGIEHITVDSNQLSNNNFTANTPKRCYYCKNEFYSKIKEIAKNRGFSLICDGTNYDDQGDYRPGIKAAREMNVRTPLLEASLTKKDIRTLSREAGLKSWNLPAAACLASRIPYYESITTVKLKKISAAEKFLKALGHHIVRVRYYGNTARIEVEQEKMAELLTHIDKIIHRLKEIGFTYITMDLEGFRSGSMNEVLENYNKHEKRG